MQLSHRNGLSAVFYFFYGIEITSYPVLAAANEGDSQQSKHKWRECRDYG